MKPVIHHHARALLLSVATAALLTTSAYADCTYELFNISSVKGTTVGEFVDQISDECGMSVIVGDKQSEEILKKQMNKTFLKNLTVNEVLDLIIKENNLQYTLQNNILRISYLTTKTYNIDYITSKRIGSGSTNIKLSSNTGQTSGSNQTDTKSDTKSDTKNSHPSNNGASSQSGTNITSIDEVAFWETLEKEISSVLSRPEDDYRLKKIATGTEKDSPSIPEEDIHNLLINKSAGLVTVTGTGKQINRLDNYVIELQKKMQSQVMIDVKMYSVKFSNGETTGIDWSQIYNLQNFDLGVNRIRSQNVETFKDGKILTGTYGDEVYQNVPTGNVQITTNSITGDILRVDDVYESQKVSGARNAVSGVANLFNLSHNISINNLIMFLKTQGDVYAISNPKIMTLNNQPALITAGTELFYKTINTSTLAGGTTGEQAQTELISSVFSGVLLDITPEIANDGSITLRINPSVSEVASSVSSDNKDRTMPPDLTRRQISSVVTVKDGNKIVLGGLISRGSENKTTKVPLLGDIPVLGYLFKQEGLSEKVEELVIIIEPHIVKKENNTLSLGDLGYSRLDSAIEKDKIEQTMQTKKSKDGIAALKKEMDTVKEDSK